MNRERPDDTTRRGRGFRARRWWLVLLPLIVAACSRAGSGEQASRSAGSSAPGDTIAFAAPGRVEGRSEAVEVGAGGEGVVDSVFVVEGEVVVAGQVLMRLRCRDLGAQAAVAAAQVQVARQARVRVMRGSRDEERLQASARAEAAVARRELARKHFERLEGVATAGAELVSAADRDDARQGYEAAAAEAAEAEHARALAEAGPLPEEVARAAAELAAAERSAEALTARLAECTIRSPVNGTVLRRHVEPGELVSLAYPRPVATLADLSVMRVRAEIDERDIARVHVGQRVQVQADAFGDQKAAGRVVAVQAQMGRKQVRSGDPAEKSDRDVLEAVIELEPTELPLVVGLRVTACFLAE